MMIDEIRRPDGTIFAFDVRSGYATFRSLCRFLARIPDVQFTRRPPPFLAISRENIARFTYRSREFEVCIPFSDYWVGPADPAQTYPEIEDLLQHTRTSLLPGWKRRIIDVMCFDFRSAFER
jgi:hypothetical protein